MSLGKNSNTRLCWETREHVRKIVLGYAKVRCEDRGLNPVFTNVTLFENESGNIISMLRPWKCLVNSTEKL
jgi:hypothetical protein